jgi:hypothetical protein
MVIVVNEIFDIVWRFRLKKHMTFCRMYPPPSHVGTGKEKNVNITLKMLNWSEAGTENFLHFVILCTMF